MNRVWIVEWYHRQLGKWFPLISTATENFRKAHSIKRAHKLKCQQGYPSRDCQFRVREYIRKDGQK